MTITGTAASEATAHPGVSADVDDCDAATEAVYPIHPPVEGTSWTSRCSSEDAELGDGSAETPDPQAEEGTELPIAEAQDAVKAVEIWSAQALEQDSKDDVRAAATSLAGEEGV